MQTTDRDLNIPIWPMFGIILAGVVIWELAGVVFAMLVLAIGGIAGIVYGGSGRALGLVALVVALVMLGIFLLTRTF